MYDTLLVTVSLSDLKVDQSELATGGDAMYCNEVCSQNATRIKIQPAPRIQILESDIRMQPVPVLVSNSMEIEMTKRGGVGGYRKSPKFHQELIRISGMRWGGWFYPIQKGFTKRERAS